MHRQHPSLPCMPVTARSAACTVRRSPAAHPGKGCHFDCCKWSHDKQWTCRHCVRDAEVRLFATLHSLSRRSSVCAFIRHLAEPSCAVTLPRCRRPLVDVSSGAAANIRVCRDGWRSFWQRQGHDVCNCSSHIEACHTDSYPRRPVERAACSGCLQL